MSEEGTFILNLFESFWFQHGVFTSKPTPACQEPTAADDKPKLSRITTTTTTLMRKCHSDQFLSSKGGCPSDTQTQSPSPNSVLGPHLQTILSGKEVDSFDESPPKLDDHICPDLKPGVGEKRGHDKKKGRRVRRKSTGSRSLSELEFQELKGFMDLGFVFSEEDKDSKLVSIIPGLQRFGKNGQDSDKCSSVSRPYLSEAWEQQIVKDLRIPPNFGNEMELKDHLKCWAHNVASAVR